MLLGMAILSMGLLSSTLGAADDAAALDRPLVTIDDFTLTTLHLGLFAGQTGRNPQDGEAQLRMLNELASHFMLANSEQGRALEQRKDVRAALDVARARLLAQTFVREQLESLPVDETEVRRRYDERYAGEAQREYKASHILLADRGAALAVIAALNDGADFATLARQRSIGPSKTNGGELGWFEAGDMVPEFSRATASLEDGSYSREPVKSEFGWHVILREDSRVLPQPNFATARPEIEAEIRQDTVTRMIGDIRAAATVTVHSPDSADTD
jgi:peptidyl-prolyl cis-trans isomerase C